MADFKCGYVNIFGFPNVGKSTLMNKMMGDKISIVTHKAQTTRQRILGILTGANYQIIFSDTPGILNPKYELQKTMITEIQEAYEDADIILYMVEATDSIEKHIDNIEKVKKLQVPFYIIINKIDLSNQENLEELVVKWKEQIEEEKIIPISALHNFNIPNLLKVIMEGLPVHEPYFPEDIMTDKSERFVASEIVREKIFLKFKEEVPYATEVVVTAFKEDEDIIRIYADIIVERKTQKPIIIGKGGKALKEIGTDARKDMEAFWDKKIYLELYVKVRENWRNKKNFLKQFGYRTEG